MHMLVEMPVEHRVPPITLPNISNLLYHENNPEVFWDNAIDASQMDHSSQDAFSMFDVNQTLYGEDTDVKIKPEPTECQYNNCYSPVYSEEDQLERMGEMVFEMVGKDIEHTCAVLDIPKEPVHWTVEHVQKWVLWMLNEYKLPISDVDNFQLDGLSLCMLKEQDFVARSSLSGSSLFAQLEIWRNASHLSPVKTEASADPSCWGYPPVNSSSILNIHSQLRVPEPSLSPAPSDASLDSSCSHYSGETEETSTSNEKPVRTKQTIHLWQFLKELLVTPGYTYCIRWINRQTGIFKIEDSTKVAKLWGKRKNRPAMNYDKLSRSIRQYYKKGIIKKTEHSKRLVYQFCTPYL